jgi:hypothetical protein
MNLKKSGLNEELARGVIEKLRVAPVLDRKPLDDFFRKEDCDGGQLISQILILSEAPKQNLVSWRKYFNTTEPLCVAIVPKEDGTGMILKQGKTTTFERWEVLCEKIQGLIKQDGYAACRVLQPDHESEFPALVAAVRGMGFGRQMTEHFSPVVQKAFQTAINSAGKSDIVPHEFDPFEL